MIPKCKSSDAGNSDILLLCLIFFLVLFVFLKIYFIFLFLAALFLRCCAQAFSSCRGRRILSVAVCGLLIVRVSLCCGVRSLGTQASVVVALGLSSCGSRALEHRLSSCGARA